MTNEPMWREKIEDLTYAIQMENKGNKSYEQCRNEAIDLIINRELTSLGQAMVDLFPSVRYEITAVEARNLLTAELSKRGILIPNV